MAALLPWRRGKWVLVEHEERKRPGKGWPPRLSCASLLANLLGSCPELWAPGALPGLFRSRRRTAQLNTEEPTYRVWYLGNAATLQAKGEGCTEAAVEKIWARSQGGGRGAQMRLTLGLHGLHLQPAEKEARRPGHAYLLHRITYCGADQHHPEVFAWVYRHQVKNKAVALRCHAVLLSKAEKAQAVARRLFQTSAAAFNEFKRLQRQSDSRRLRWQLLGEAIVPLVPLRRLLNSKCPYRPPLDRSRNAPRLSSIQEEEEEEEEEERRKNERPAAARHLSMPRHCPAGAAQDWLATHMVICSIGGFGSASTILWADHTASSHHVAPILDPKMARRHDRPEMQTLVREFQFCTLRGPLSAQDATPWVPTQESPYLSR